MRIVKNNMTSKRPSMSIGVCGIFRGILSSEKKINHHSNRSPIINSPLKIIVSLFKVVEVFVKWHTTKKAWRCWGIRIPSAHN